MQVYCLFYYEIWLAAAVDGKIILYKPLLKCKRQKKNIRLKLCNIILFWITFQCNNLIFKSLEVNLPRKSLKTLTWKICWNIICYGTKGNEEV